MPRVSAERSLILKAALYLYGWYIFARCLRMQWKKKHGSGPRDWGSAIKIALCARYIVDGQHRHPVKYAPRWLLGALMNTPPQQWLELIVTCAIAAAVVVILTEWVAHLW